LKTRKRPESLQAEPEWIIEEIHIHISRTRGDADL